MIRQQMAGALRSLRYRTAVVLRSLAFPLAGLAAIAAAWYFGPAELRNLVLVLLGPFVAILGLAPIVIFLVFGLPKPAPVRRPAPRRPLRSIRAHAEVVQGEVMRGPFRELESGDVR